MISTKRRFDLAGFGSRYGWQPVGCGRRLCLSPIMPMTIARPPTCAARRRLKMSDHWVSTWTANFGQLGRCCFHALGIEGVWTKFNSESIGSGPGAVTLDPQQLNYGSSVVAVR